MKLKKYFEVNEREGFDDIDQPFDTKSETEKWMEDFDSHEVEEIAQEDIIENLLSTLRKMIKNSGFENSYVFTDDEGSINVQFVLNKTEKIGSVMKVMNLLKKLETDILIQYESEFDLWEVKSGDPLITAKFFYDEDVAASTSLDDIENEVREAQREKQDIIYSQKYCY